MEVRVSDEAGTADPAFGPQGIVGIVERAARAALADRGVGEGELSITLLDDDAMAEMNRRWKGREGPTDVLSFPLSEPGEPLVGDVYLGVDRALAQAGELGEPPARELARIAVHGTLHALGWDHPESDRESSEMWAHQERIVRGLEIA